MMNFNELSPKSKEYWALLQAEIAIQGLGTNTAAKRLDIFIEHGFQEALKHVKEQGKAKRELEKI